MKKNNQKKNINKKKKSYQRKFVFAKLEKNSNPVNQSKRSSSQWDS